MDHYILINLLIIKTENYSYCENLWCKFSGERRVNDYIQEKNVGMAI